MLFDGSLGDYSTSEHHINASYKGSALYRKVVSFGTLPNNTFKDVAHGITGATQLVDFTAIVSNGTTAYSVDRLTAGSLTGFQMQVDSDDGSNIRFLTDADWTAYSATVTLVYTKSDASGTPSLAMLNRAYPVYVPPWSTDPEELPFRNTDGRPLFRKVIQLGALRADAGSTTTDHNLTSVQDITQLWGIATNSTSGKNVPLPYVGGTAPTTVLELSIAEADEGLVVVDQAATDYSAFTTNVFVEYTRT